MHGSCLCGAVKFKLNVSELKIYQCHCSECRKVTGSSSNASCLIPEEQFEWLKGQEYIKSYKHTSGYRSDFCNTCGSLVPNPTKGTSLFWVPAGAINDTEKGEIIVHICVNSKAKWEPDIIGGTQFPETPEFDELVELIIPNHGS